MRIMGSSVVVAFAAVVAVLLTSNGAPAPVAVGQGPQPGDHKPVAVDVVRPVVVQQPPPAQPEELPPATPYETVKLALADAGAVALAGDPHVPVEYVRYLSLHNMPSAERVRMKQTIDFTLNSLSSEFIIRLTAGLPGNAKDPVLVRVNLLDYGIDPANWDKLFDQGSGDVPQAEPYYHARLLRQYPAGKDGKPGKKEEVLASAPGLLSYAEVRLLEAHAIGEEDTAIGQLVRLTNSRNPVGRADWFVYYGWLAPAYYELLGLDIKRGKSIFDAVGLKEADFDRLGNVDERLAFRSLIAAVTDTKKVANHNRVLLRYTTVNGTTGGYKWESNDTDNGTDKTDYLNNLDKFDHPVVQAKELILTLLNGLQGYAVVNGDGVLINVAAANIAIHSEAEPTLLKDKQVYVGRNCAYCHREGIYPIADRVRKLANGKIALLISDDMERKYGPPAKMTPAKRKEYHDLSTKINNAFYPRVEDFVAHDQAVFATSVAACNGLAPAANGSQLELFHFKYHDGPIDLKRAAWEVGWPPARLEKALKTGIGLDYTNTGLIQVPPVLPDIVPWERQGFQQLSLLLMALEAEAGRRGVTVDELLKAAPN